MAFVYGLVIGLILALSSITIALWLDTKEQKTNTPSKCKKRKIG